MYAGYAGVSAGEGEREAGGEGERDGDGADSRVGTVAGPARAVVAATCDNNKSFYCSAAQLRQGREQERESERGRERGSTA